MIEHKLESRIVSYLRKAQFLRKNGGSRGNLVNSEGQPTLISRKSGVCRTSQFTTYFQIRRASAHYVRGRDTCGLQAKHGLNSLKKRCLPKLQPGAPFTLD